MTDFQLYDVVNHCRACGVEYPGKAFLPQGTEPRFGLCPPCMEVDEVKMAKLKQPPKDHGIKTPRAEPEHRREVRRSPIQRRWEPRD